MAGLPRSGSTLLKSLLNQNPEVHTEPVSPVMELMYWNDHYLRTVNSILVIQNQNRHIR